MDELTLVRSFRAGQRPVPGDAHERVRARLLGIVDIGWSVDSGGRQAVVAEQPVTTATRKRPRRRWLALRVATVSVAAAAVVLGVLGALPGGGSSAVERAAAAVTGPQGTIVHAYAIGTFTRASGNSATWSIEAWRQSSAPFDSREIVSRNGELARPELATADGVREFYDPRTNTIYTVPGGPQSGSPAAKDAERGSNPDVDPLAPGFTIEKLLALLASGGAREDGRVTVEGRDEIRIVSSNPETTLLVDAATYTPLEWRVSAPGYALTLRFQTYEWLPATPANAALVNLSAQHPGAARRAAPTDDRADAGTK